VLGDLGGERAQKWITILEPKRTGGGHDLFNDGTRL
jgi:hypothetical protein